VIYNVYLIINRLIIFQTTVNARPTVRSSGLVQLFNKALNIIPFGTYHPLDKFASIIRGQRMLWQLTQRGRTFQIHVTPLKLLKQYSLYILLWSSPQIKI